ncbi:hypothetical protein V757_00385 [Pelistega indica]|uniref:Uncharacterized protein n=2 Tax=Pelistega indica TaxID=1414851 RepID=V8GBI9_9BURK|nr:hypothetical protein V757_00385 [Pelistega indica]
MGSPNFAPSIYPAVGFVPMDDWEDMSDNDVDFYVGLKEDILDLLPILEDAILTALDLPEFFNGQLPYIFGVEDGYAEGFRLYIESYRYGIHDAKAFSEDGAYEYWQALLDVTTEDSGIRFEEFFGQYVRCRLFMNYVLIKLLPQLFPALTGQMGGWTGGSYALDGIAEKEFPDGFGDDYERLLGVLHDDLERRGWLQSTPEWRAILRPTQA